MIHASAVYWITCDYPGCAVRSGRARNNADAELTAADDEWTIRDIHLCPTHRRNYCRRCDAVVTGMPAGPGATVCCDDCRPLVGAA